jgi:hypothetical protein
VALIVALLLPVLLGCAALALEVGSWSIAKIELQRRADLAAFAAANAYRLGSTAQVAAGIGADVAALNGATAGSRSWNSSTNTLAASDVTVSFVAGVRSSSDTAAKVVATRALALSFGRLFTTATSITVSATAWAENLSSGTGGQPCVLATSTSGTGITVSSAADISASNCTVRSNAGVSVSSAASINAPWVYATSASVTSAGSITNGTSTVTSSNVGTWNNSAPLDAAAGTISDPYASVSSVQSAFNSLEPQQGSAYSLSSAAKGSISPGTYSSISVGSSATLTMQPGLYIVNGNVSISTAATVTGTGGVTIVLSGQFSVSSAATATLTAPLASASSGIPGVVIAGNGTISQSLGSAGTVNLTGVIYFPKATLSVSSAGNGNGCLEAIAASVTLSSAASFSSNCSSYGAQTFGSINSSSTELVQ